MSDPFPIIEVPLDASQDIEDLGTKEKFWFRHPSLGCCLFKKARLNTGEDWAEKIAAQLCKLLGLPHAEQELAIYKGEKGTVSPSFLTVLSLLVGKFSLKDYLTIHNIQKIIPNTQLIMSSVLLRLLRLICP